MWKKWNCLWTNVNFYIKSDLHLIKTPPPSLDIFVWSHKIRMKHFGYTFSHIKSSSLVPFLPKCHLIFGREAGPMNIQRGGKVRMREKHHIYHSLPSTLCWLMMLLDHWSLALIPRESAATVHGPAVISHYQNSQPPLCSNPVRPLSVYQVSLKHFHSFAGSSENSICSIWLLLKKSGRLFQIQLGWTCHTTFYVLGLWGMWPFSHNSSDLPA